MNAISSFAPAAHATDAIIGAEHAQADGDRRRNDQSENGGSETPPAEAPNETAGSVVSLERRILDVTA